MSEWMKEHAWRACRGLNRPSWVRIPVSPLKSQPSKHHGLTEGAEQSYQTFSSSITQTPILGTAIDRWAGNCYVVLEKIDSSRRQKPLSHA